MLGLVIKREFSTLLGSKAMKISTTVLVLLFLVAGLVGRFLLNDDDADSGGPQGMLIGVTTEAVPLIPYLDLAPYDDVTEIGDANPREAYNAEGADFDAIISGDPESPVISSGNQDTPVREIAVLAATEYLVDQNGALTPQLSKQLHAVTEIRVVDVTENAINDNPIGYGVGMISVVILMMITIMGVSTLSAGVVEEKSSRVVEILLTTVRPRTLLLGKILGIGSAMLVIFIIYIAGIFGGLWISGLLEGAGVVLDALGALGVWGYIPMVLMWIVLGYFTFAAITGGLSATVSRQEDLGAVQTPIIFMQMIPMYVAMYLVPFLPDATITKVLSYIPAFSPYLMPMRTAIGDVPLWEQGLAVGLSLIAIPLLGALAGKIYERSILHVGERVKLTKVFSRSA
ncbi:MAG: ABC transporter permease [Ancrocorticia sp.]